MTKADERESACIETPLFMHKSHQERCGVNYSHLPRSGLPTPRFLRWELPCSPTRLADSPRIHSGRSLRRRGFGLSRASDSALRSAWEALRASIPPTITHTYRFRGIVQQAIVRARTPKTALYPYPPRSLRSLLEDGGLAPAIQLKHTVPASRPSFDVRTSTVKTDDAGSEEYHRSNSSLLATSSG